MSQLSIEDIGRRVAHYRKLNGWSARQLAANTDGVVTRDTVANIESGRRTDVGIRQFLAIALALRIPPDALLADLQHPLTPSEIHYPGPAPAPLDRSAPQVAFAAWLNGQIESDSTPAARWVTRVTALLTVYVTAQDVAAADDARRRMIARPPSADLAVLAADRARARSELLTLGVRVPEAQ